MKKNSILIPAVISIGIVFALFIYVSKGKNNISNNTGDASPIPTTSTSKNEDFVDKNGAYTNNTYGYKFEYPAKIFDIAGISGENYFERRSSDKTQSFGLDSRVYKFSNDDKLYPGYGPTLYFAAIDKKDGETIYQYDNKAKKLVAVGTKISNVSVQGYKGVFYEYVEKFEDYRLGVHYFSFDVMKDDKIYYVRVLAKDEASLNSIKSAFEKTIKSLNFI